MTLILGASFALPIVTNARYEFSKIKSLSETEIGELEEQGLKIRSRTKESLEELHKEYMSEGYNESYSMVSQVLP